MDYILETRQLTKKFGSKLAVDHVDMHIQKGDIYGLIGKNGAGKTTIMRMMLSLAFPTSGEIYMFGKPVSGKSDVKIGSLIESPGIFKNYSAYDNLKAFCVLYGIDDAVIEPILRIIGLADTGKKKAGQFSLGMKQRLGIGIALLAEPEIIILDEPVNGLDPAGIKDVRDLVIKLNQEKGVTFLISSHLLDELSKMVTKYGIINNGCLLEELDAAEMERRGSHQIAITVSDPLKSADLIATMIPPQNITIAGNQLLLNANFDDSAKFNKLLVENGIWVSALELRAESIEQYYMHAMGDGR
ncbi:MAG: ATP-binding cassette domain-containing protein [Lachnospiraceae bacterium]|nr:ATP-binding cassette domain-containing protein [Lachnospiraceae bacterium]MBR5178703.1 ATP-binding cassette domain-containing protein [Lachnospiraceae bacterium]